MGNFNPKLPTKYSGTNKYITFFVTRDRSPTGADFRQPETGTLYSIGTVWQVGKNPTTGTEGDLWMLSKIVANVGYWVMISSGVVPTGGVLTLSDTANTLVFPTVGGNIQLEGTAGQINIVSNPGSNKLTFSLPGGGGAVDSFAVPHGTSPVVPTALGLITITEGGGIIITGGLNTYSIALNGSVVGQTITGDSGGALSPTAGNWNIFGSGSIATSGSVSTLTVALTGLTTHNVLVGAGTTTITKVAPSASSGIPFISQGASADPLFGTAVVAGGGTGATSFTAYTVICAGTTSTSPFQNVVNVGTSGQVLTSNGAAALPTWQNSGSGGTVQQVRATSTSSVSSTKTITPTTTATTANTDSILTCAITPTSASNVLIFEFCVPYSCTVDAVVSFCLFEGTTFRTGFPRWQNGNISGRDDTMYFKYYRTAGTTGATTFDVRWGTESGTLRSLQNGSGTAYYGGAGNSATTFTITEVTP